MDIDRYKLTINRFTAELPGEVDRNLRGFIKTEIEIHEVATQDNHDGTFNQVYKAKVVGATELEQMGNVVRSKSKRKHSQRLRGSIFYLAQELGVDEEELYDRFMNGVIANAAGVWEFVK